MPAPRPELIGEIFTDALPAEDPVLYGHADLEPKGAFQARSYQTFRLTYTCGRYGLDDTGSIKVVFRFTADGGDLQTHDPTAPNFVTATASNGTPLKLSFDSSGHMRPWYRALTIFVHKGFLREGDTIVIVVGDTSGGSPGHILQSMCESAFTWRVIADVCATGHYIPIAESPTIDIVPGPPAVWKAILPTLRRPGETFRLGIKAEDRYGNPSNQVDRTLRLTASSPVGGLPETVAFPPGQRSLVIDGLSAATAGTLDIAVHDADGSLLARTNPLMIRAGTEASWWADMHGQSGESVGLNTAREYFDFARNMAFLDATSHQANDFQVNGAFWAHINELTAEYHEDDRFLTLPGYEWSGNTGVGGDRNVYFRTEGRPIRRSSHALIADRAEIMNDAPTARELFAALRNEDCVAYAHIGGRPADVAYAHDPRIETAMEIHSAWGTFEWLMADCFEQGYRVGVVANSDGHKGRPGASYPGTSQFGAYGGLTCFLMDRLTRDDLFACLKNRRHYATTGERIHIDLSVEPDTEAERFAVDPHVGEGPVTRTDVLGMGDIARVTGTGARVSFTSQARLPILRVDVLNGMDTVATVHNPATQADTGPLSRVRLLWRGAMVKGRGARASWEGRVTVRGARIARTTDICAWNPDAPSRRVGDDTVEWESVTAGNFGAIDLWLEDMSDETTLDIQTNHAAATLRVADIGIDDCVVDAGGLDLELRLSRLPDTLDGGPVTAHVPVQLATDRDNPLWIRVTTEDGFQAWTSPVYLFS
ncbi:hypothetical protein [Pacificispira sp.]|uniref:hypothetical protein n=1 Tax=Pacificispira sp. TaxID=2888761 RepID=UPI003BACAC1B